VKRAWNARPILAVTMHAVNASWSFGNQPEQRRQPAFGPVADAGLDPLPIACDVQDFQADHWGEPSPSGAGECPGLDDDAAGAGGPNRRLIDAG
jgi:hypothetical protein